MDGVPTRPREHRPVAFGRLAAPPRLGARQAEPASPRRETPAGSLDYLVRLKKDRLRDRQAKGLGRLEVDDQLELGRLFEGQVAWPGTLEDSVHLGHDPL